MKKINSLSLVKAEISEKNFWRERLRENFTHLGMLFELQIWFGILHFLESLARYKQTNFEKSNLFMFYCSLPLTWLELLPSIYRYLFQTIMTTSNCVWKTKNHSNFQSSTSFFDYFKLLHQWCQYFQLFNAILYCSYPVICSSR